MKKENVCSWVCPKSLRVLSKTSENVKGYVELNQKKPYVSKLSERPNCKVLLTGKDINLKLVGPLLLFLGLRLQMTLVVTATVATSNSNHLQL